MSQTTTQKLSGDSFHNLSIDKAFRILKAGLDSNLISKQDYDLIYEFVTLKQGCSHISVSRIRKLIFHLTSWRKYLGEYSSNSIGDLANGILTLQRSKTAKGTDFSPETISDYIRILKLFYRWLIDEGYSSITEKQIAKLKTPKTPRSKYSEEDILSIDDIKIIIAACKDLEELAIFSLLYEGALRIGEIGTLTWDMIEFHKTHVNLNIEYKTGFQRQIPIIAYKEYMQLWRNIKDPGPGKPVFLNGYKEPYQYPALRKRLRVLAKRAGLQTTLPPHLVRHTRITHMIQEGMSRETVGLIGWGQVNAPELDRYAHMFGSTDDMVLKHYGLLKQNNKNNSLEMSPLLCPECQYVNPPGSLFCFSCSKALTKEALQAVDEFSKNVTPEILQKALALFLQTKMMGDAGN